MTEVDTTVPLLVSTGEEALVICIVVPLDCVVADEGEAAEDWNNVECDAADDEIKVVEKSDREALDSLMEADALLLT